MSVNDESLLDVGQAATLLNMKPSWIYAKAEAGELPSFRLGKYRRFRRSELIDWLNKQKQ